MAEVFGSKSSHTSWDASSVSPSPMASIMEEASCSMASDCRARTESGSIMSRMTMTMETVNTAPAAMSTGHGERRLRERPHERDARQGGNGGREHFLVELGHPDAPRGNRARFALRHNRTP